MISASSPALLFVINPVSGGKHKKNQEDEIKKFYAQLSQSVEFIILTGKNDAEAVKNRIEQLKPQKVIAVGGDGTVSLVANLLLHTDMQMGILPAGSANGMATELNIPEDVQQALEIVQKDNVQKMDAICINKKFCYHLSDIGLNAKLISIYEKEKLRGKLAYARLALKLVFKQQNMRVIINNGNQTIKRNACMIVLANASKYGTGAVINPIGDVHDGLFEVIIIRRLGFLTFLKIWLTPVKSDPKNVEVIQASSVHIETSRRVHFQVDGEYCGKVREVDAEIIKQQLNVLLP